MSFSKIQVRQCFNRAKDTYDDFNHLQLSIGKYLISSMNDFNMDANFILDVGCGTGVVTQNLAVNHSPCSLTGIDISDKLLTLAQHRLNSAACLLCADFDKIPLQNDQFDLVFSNMVLQWSPNLANTFTEITRVSRPAAYLALTMPVAGTFEPLKQQLFKLTGQQYLNTFAESQQIIHCLQSNGYEIIHHQLQEYNLYFPNLLAAFQSFKRLGADCRSNSVTLPQSLFRKTGTQNISLDYQISFIIARINHVV